MNPMFHPSMMADRPGQSSNYSMNPMGNPTNTIVKNAPPNGRVISYGQTFVDYEMSRTGGENNKFTTEALRGIQNPSPLSMAFFSEANIKFIQDTIRYEVFKQTGVNVSPQSKTELEIIMRGIYLQYSRHIANQLKEELAELDNFVVNYAVPVIVTNIKQEVGYLKDISQLPVPLELPRNVGSAGTRINKSVASTF